MRFGVELPLLLSPGAGEEEPFLRRGETLRDMGGNAHRGGPGAERLLFTAGTSMPSRGTCGDGPAEGGNFGGKDAL